MLQAIGSHDRLVECVCTPDAHGAPWGPYVVGGRLFEETDAANDRVLSGL